MDFVSTSEDLKDNGYYCILGYNRDMYYFFSKEFQQVFEISHSGINFDSATRLAPAEFWENLGFGSAKNFRIAKSIMTRIAHSMLFNHEGKVRGRGVWKDGDDYVFHMGEHSYINGSIEPITLNEIKNKIDTKYIYEQDVDMGFNKLTLSATDEESKKLADICNRFSWMNPISGALMSGWLVAAQICGVLDWRPHIWVTGESGSGKTTVDKYLIKKILGNYGIYTEDATEASIRQFVKCDARPVVYDEAEPSKAFMAVVNLVRKSSSGASIMRGTQDGRGQFFKMRSCFCFTSIDHSFKDEDADGSRISILTLKKKGLKKSEWDSLFYDLVETINEEFASKILMRSIKNMDNILHNIESFIGATAIAWDNQRAADQVGTLLGCHYSLLNGGKVSVKQAEKWIEEKSDLWSEYSGSERGSDHEELISLILNHTTDTTISNDGMNSKLTIMDLIDGMTGHNGNVDRSRCESILKKCGILVRDEVRDDKKDLIMNKRGFLIISKSSSYIKANVLKGTRWQNSWVKVLERGFSDDFIKTAPIKFNGMSARAIAIPLESVR